MDDEAGGLFNIALSDSESEEQVAASAAKPSRTGQTEEDFQAVKQTYHAKVENGNVSLPQKPLRAMRFANAKGSRSIRM